MSSSLLCISNNPLVSKSVSPALFKWVQGNGRDVLLRARDLVHLGWRLLGHPLYGNYHPCKSPYRTLVLSFNSEEEAEGLLNSLVLIEEAVEICRKSDGVCLVSGVLTESIAHDYAILDNALMSDTLRRYRMLPNSFG